MGWKSREWTRSADDRDLRQPVTLLANDALSGFLARLPSGCRLLEMDGDLEAAGLDRESLGFDVLSAHLGAGPESSGPAEVALKFEPGSIRAAVVASSFFFLAKPLARQLVAELNRVLGPDGTVLATFPPLWNPNLAGEALLDAASPDGPDADIVRRGTVSVRYARWTTRELDQLFGPGTSVQVTTQKNGVRRAVFRRRPAAGSTPAPRRVTVG